MNALNLVPLEPSVNIQSRESLINWLVWNDPNGCYTDTDSINEDLPILTLETALNLYFDQKEG
jgi:hypothetical protein